MTDTPVTSSYITTLELADAYFAARLGTDAWDDASSADQAKALKQATKLIDRLPLRGVKYMLDGTQALQFPRQYREGYDMDELTGVAAVPQSVKDACCEVALQLLKEDSSSEISETELQANGVQSFSMGELSVSFVNGAGDRLRGLKSPEAMALMAKHIARSFPIV